MQPETDLQPSPYSTEPLPPLDRHFTFTWDRSKLNLKESKRSCTGEWFASSGFVALANGAGYNSIDEMLALNSKYGQCRVEFDDGDTIESDFAHEKTYRMVVKNAPRNGGDEVAG